MATRQASSATVSGKPRIAPPKAMRTSGQSLWHTTILPTPPPHVPTLVGCAVPTPVVASPPRPAACAVLAPMLVGHAAPTPRLSATATRVAIPPATLLPGLEHDDPHAARHGGGHLIPGPQRLLGADTED